LMLRCSMRWKRHLSFFPYRLRSDEYFKNIQSYDVCDLYIILSLLCTVWIVIRNDINVRLIVVQASWRHTASNWKHTTYNNDQIVQFHS
jgi:hypothetical protein